MVAENPSNASCAALPATSPAATNAPDLPPSTTTPEVYVIPDYHASSSSSQQAPGSRPQIFVLPYVPFPSGTTSANAAHYLTSTAPHFARHDPPPEYNSWNQGAAATNSETDARNNNASGSINRENNCVLSYATPLLNTPVPLEHYATNLQSSSCYASPGNPDYLDGYDTVLYPNLYATLNEASSGYNGGGQCCQHHALQLPQQCSQRSRSVSGLYHSRRVYHRDSFDRDDDDEATITEYEVAAHASATERTRSQDVFTVRRWVLIVLVLCLLFTISLLVGISLQHFQLLSRMSSEEIRKDEGDTNEAVSSAPEAANEQEAEDAVNATKIAPYQMPAFGFSYGRRGKFILN